MDKHLRACIAEMVGTFFLTFIGAAAMCTDKTDQPGAVGLLGIAIAHGLAMAIAVSATMNISGGHINPAVTITMYVYHKMDLEKTIYYIVSQLLGAVIAGGLIVAFYGTSASEAAGAAHWGAPHIGKVLQDAAPERYYWVAIGIEIVLTFLLVFAVFGTAVDPRAPKIGGFGIGLTVCADMLAGGPLTGAAMNPARAFGPAIWEAGILGKFSMLQETLVYLIGPVVGGILAGGLYLRFIMAEDPHPHPVEKK